MSAVTRVGSTNLELLPFVDRVDECRLICHPDIQKVRVDRRGDPKACCVVVSKQPGAGKTSLGLESLKIARDNPPEGYTPGAWRARLPVCTLHCEAGGTDTLVHVLTRVAGEAIKKLGQLKADVKGINSNEFYGVAKVGPYRACDIEQPSEEVDVERIVSSLWEKRRSLGLSRETRKRLKEFKSQLVDELYKQPQAKWQGIVNGIVERPSDAFKILHWLSMKAAVDRLAQACADWNELFGFGTEDRPAALLIVVDEAQCVLPGEGMDDVFDNLEQNRVAIHEMEKKKTHTGAAPEIETIENTLKSLIEDRAEQEVDVAGIRNDVKSLFEIMKPIFGQSRFLWTGVNSAAVDLQMSRNDQGTSFRVISVALPPLDVIQWAEAFEKAPSTKVAANLMQEIIDDLRAKPTIEAAWADIDGPEEFKDEERKRRALVEVMSCTGGWPGEVSNFVVSPGKEEWNWIDAVFYGPLQQRMKDATIQLLDHVYLAPKASVLQLLGELGYSRPIEQGRIFYELLHTSGLRLVREDGETSAVYVPFSRGVAGVSIINSLGSGRLRHTTGSLFLLSQLRKPTAIYARRGEYEVFTHNPAEEATIIILSHLDTFHGSKLKKVFPWLGKAPSDIANKPLESGGLRAFRGLVVNRSRSSGSPPLELERHGMGRKLVRPNEFKSWLTEWCLGGDESFSPCLYVFGPLSTSGDILLMLKDLHIHIQIKNAANPEWEKEIPKMRAVACEEVTNIFVLINYYDKEKGMPRSFLEISTRRYATIQGIITWKTETAQLEHELPATREAGTADSRREVELTEVQCLVADLENLWAERCRMSVIQGLDMIRHTPSSPSLPAFLAEQKAPQSDESETLQEPRTKRQRPTPASR